MQQITIKKTLLASSLAIALAAPAAFATNGMAPTGLGQEHKAMGGAAAGNPVNTMSMATNPAAASFIDDGWDVEAELFKPNRTVVRKALPPAMGGVPSATYKGDEKSIFLIPGGGYKKQINDKYAVGLTMYGNGGMNTEFKSGPTFVTPNGIKSFSNSSAHTGINLEQLFVSPTLGIKLNDKHSLGVSVNLVYQQFSATGLKGLKDSGDPRFTLASLASLSDKGTASATGIGATIGWMGKLTDTTTAGVSYRLETKMSKFKKYKGLFPNQGRMNVPAALTVGFSEQVTPKTKVAVDIQQVYYSKIDSIGNKSSKHGEFGSTNGPGFGWDDQTIVKIGVKHQLSPKLALMAGYNHGDSPIGPEDTFFGAITPAVVEGHLSLGAEYKLNKKASIIGSYTHAFSNEVKGDLAQRQPYDLKMDQDAIGIGYSVKF